MFSWLRIFRRAPAPVSLLPEPAFLSVFPKADPLWANIIENAWIERDFRNRYARAGFLGICGNETGGFTRVSRENMSYSLVRAKQIFLRAREHPETCTQKLASPETFANWIYADRLGNGDEASGDGWNYRGGGIVQLTGRDNFRAAGAALGIDLLSHPDLIVTPVISARIATWYMRTLRPAMYPLLCEPDAESFERAVSYVGHFDSIARGRQNGYRQSALGVLSK